MTSKSDITKSWLESSVYGFGKVVLGLPLPTGEPTADMTPATTCQSVKSLVWLNELLSLQRGSVNSDAYARAARRNEPTDSDASLSL